MRVYFYLLLIVVIIFPNKSFSKLALEEENFLKKLETSNPLDKKKIILKKDQL
ncbi:MAG: hypothetical protein CFH34_01476, partial [Alphaproteobacteria bacterium MarineAlpha9_Bin4]